MYGFGNWTEVAGSVGTKNKSQCIEHYNAVYMNSPCFPLPVRLCENSFIDMYAFNQHLHALSNHSLAPRICLMLWERVKRSFLLWPRGMVKLIRVSAPTIKGVNLGCFACEI